MFIVDDSIDDGLSLEGVAARSDKRRHEAKFDAVLLEEQVLVLGPQLHDVAAKVTRSLII